MSENQNVLFQDMNQAQQYVESVRELYRKDKGEYRGQRTPDQKLGAELTSDEARLLVDGAFIGILTVGAFMGLDDEPMISTIMHEDELKEKEQEPIKAGFSWHDFRSEFERLLVGFSVMTNRMHRDELKVPSYADLGEEDRIKAASALFSDYLKHNALRFGVDTAGVHATEFKTIYTDEGGVERARRTYDKDKAYTESDIDENMKKRGYSTGVAAHPAGKLSPEEYIRLRKEFPEMDKDHFDRDVSFFRDVRKEFENRE